MSNADHNADELDGSDGDNTSKWKWVCRVEDIPRLGARVLRRDDAEDIALFRTGADRVFALVDRCPHKGGPLSQGIVFGDHVACPLHGWQIGLEDGRACAPDVGCARRFPVMLVDGGVMLRLAPSPMRASDVVATDADLAPLK
jgi:nitrite reductase (NADH) small subunit